MTLKYKSLIRIIFIIILFFSAYIPRLMYYVHCPIQWRDSYSYKHYVEIWHKTGSYSSVDQYDKTNVITPFSVFLLRFIYSLSNYSYYVTCVSLYIVLGSSTVLIAYRILRELNFNFSFSIFMCLILSSNYSLINYSTQVTRDNLYLFFCSLTLLFFFRLLKRFVLVDYLCVAFFSACSFLTRYEGFELLFIFSFGFLCCKKYSLLYRIFIIVLFFILFAFISYSVIYFISPDYRIFSGVTHKVMDYMHVFN